MNSNSGLNEAVDLLEAPAAASAGAPDQPAADRLAHALAWVEAGQDRQGRWRNRSAYNHQTWVDIERQGQPSKWVTLRACNILRAAYG